MIKFNHFIQFKVFKKQLRASNTFLLSNDKNSSEVKGGFPLLNSLAKKIRAKFFREKKFQAHMST